MKSTLIVATLLFGLSAHADVHKCRLADGRVEITNTPCTGETLRTLPAERISPAAREEAERANERMEALAEKLEATRRAEEAALREDLERLRQPAPAAPPAPSGPSADSIESCLRTLERMALDHYRRLELEAGCRNSGTIQPVYVPVPVPAYPGTSVYPAPPHRQDRQERPVPQPAPVAPAGRVINPGNPTAPYPFPAPSR